MAAPDDFIMCLYNSMRSKLYKASLTVDDAVDDMFADKLKDVYFEPCRIQSAIIAVLGEGLQSGTGKVELKADD